MSWSVGWYVYVKEVFFTLYILNSFLENAKLDTSVVPREKMFPIGHVVKGQRQTVGLCTNVVD